MTWKQLILTGIVLSAFGCNKEVVAVDFKVKPVRPSGDVTLSVAYKDKPALVYVWATWCGPCREFGPTLNKIAEEYKAKGVAMIAVAQDDFDKVVQYESKDPHSLDVFVDQYYDVSFAIKTPSLPTFAILDKQHQIIYQSGGVGPDTEAELRSKLDSVL